MLPPPYIAEVDPQGCDAMALLREAAVEARALYPDLLDAGAPWPGNTPTPARGVYLVAYQQGRPVACGALRPLSLAAVEVRRMFVTAASRRLGLARALLHELEARARGFSYAVMRLETGNRQQPAMALYQAFGFRRIAAFGEYADDPTSVCFEKPVGPERSEEGKPS
jgi:putative acetyltransferase